MRCFKSIVHNADGMKDEIFSDAMIGLPLFPMGGSQKPMPLIAFSVENASDELILSEIISGEKISCLFLKKDSCDRRFCFKAA